MGEKELRAHQAQLDAASGLGIQAEALPGPRVGPRPSLLPRQSKKAQLLEMLKTPGGQQQLKVVIEKTLMDGVERDNPIQYALINPDLQGLFTTFWGGVLDPKLTASVTMRVWDVEDAISFIRKNRAYLVEYEDFTIYLFKHRGIKPTADDLRTFSMGVEYERWRKIRRERQRKKRKEPKVGPQQVEDVEASMAASDRAAENFAAFQTFLEGRHESLSGPEMKVVRLLMEWWSL